MHNSLLLFSSVGHLQCSTGALMCKLKFRLYCTADLAKFIHGRIQRRGQGVRAPLKIHTNLGFLSNTGPDPRTDKATKPAFNRAVIGTPAKRHLNSVLLVGRWWPANSGILILPLLIKLKKKLSQSWTPSDKTFWIRA